MSDPSLICSLRQRRVEAELSQSELAVQIGVSRQALIAIEAGRQVPSTALALSLAEALRCRVEDLFSLATGAPLRARLASPGAAAGRRLAVGRVDGTWAAHPLVNVEQPGDALLDAQAENAGPVAVSPLCDVAALERNVLVAGCAPLLGLLAGGLGRRHTDARATWISANSTRSLDLLAQGLVHVAGLHLVSGETPGGHTTIVQRRFPDQTMTLMNLTRWRQGLVVAAGNPLAIRDVSDVLRPDLRRVRRDPDAGAHKLLERLLSERGLDAGALSLGPTAADHAEVASWVRLGAADVGVAIESVALAAGLDFIPLAEERFDLVLPQARLTFRPVARLLDALGQASFRRDASQLPGYNLSTAGHVTTVGAH